MLNMRLMILLLLFLEMRNVCVAATFEEANEMLQKGNAHTAATAYEELIAQGQKSAALYANLGRAYQEKGQIGVAALNYHRALMLDPRQIETRRVLAELYGKSGISTLAPHWTREFVEKIPALFFLLSGEVLFWSGAFFLVAFIFSSPPRKVLSFLWRLCLLLMGAFLLAMGWLGDPRVANARLAIITAEKGEAALSQPVSAANRVAFLPAGSAVRVLSERENWDYCQLPHGEKAWISSSSLSFVNPDHLPDRS